MWTRVPEFSWLHECIPAYIKARDAPGQQVQTWLQQRASEFSVQFPTHSTMDEDKLVNVRISIPFIVYTVTDPFFPEVVKLV